MGGAGLGCLGGIRDGTEAHMQLKMAIGACPNFLPTHATELRCFYKKLIWMTEDCQRLTHLLRTTSFHPSGLHALTLQTEVEIELVGKPMRGRPKVCPFHITDRHRDPYHHLSIATEKRLPNVFIKRGRWAGSAWV